MSGEGLPSGTVTFLFSDLVDSTLLWEEHAHEMAGAVARHDRILSDVVHDNAGAVVKFQGDGLMAVFDDANAAVRAAVNGQRALLSEEWPVPFGVRMGLCTGTARVLDGDYHGPVVNRAARAASAAHPGQILVASSTAALADAFELRDLGEYLLKGLSPMRLSQVLADGIEQNFAPLVVPPVGIDIALGAAFVGRAGEIDALRHLVTDQPFVTLTGVGGCGKTRLAVEVARQLSPRFHDGVRFADLAVITDSDGVADATARALGLADAAQQRPLDRVAEHLHNRQILCILDNCEHVIDACAELAESFIAHAGASRVLATSREPLGVAGERVYQVPSLDAAGDAMQLFAARAADVRPGFALDDANRDTVAEICERLDGIPLAIELAAARVNQLAPVQVLERLSDRFNLLTGGRRRVQRQQTLAATLDWSYDLLDEAEQVLLRRLAVFPAGFSMEAVEAVADVDDVRILGSLVSKSLVQVVEHGERFRYRLLETVRLYASEKLVAANEADEWRGRHASWVSTSLESVPLEARWFGDDPGSVDLSDLRAALEWSSTTGPPALAASLASGVDWTRYDHWREGIRWCEAVADFAGVDVHIRLRVHIMLFLLYAANLASELQLRAEQADALAEGLSDPLVAYYLAVRGGTGATVAVLTQDVELSAQVVRWMEMGVAMSDGFALPWQIYTRLFAGMGYTTLRQSDDAVRHLENAVALAKRTQGYEALAGTARASLSVYRVLAGDVGGAIALVEGIIDWPHTANLAREGPLNAVVTMAAAGDVLGARRQLADCHDSVARALLPAGIEEIVVYGAVIAGLSGDWDSTARLLAAGRLGYRRSPSSYMLYTTFRDRARAALGTDRARRLRDEGRRMSLDDAVALALDDRLQIDPTAG